LARSKSRTVSLDSATIAAFGRKPKAVRLAVAERLTRLDHLSYGLQVVFLVQGDTGRHRVTLYGTPGAERPRSALCTCPARATCSHMLAALAIDTGALDGAGTVAIA
jgi:hypothetical protein